MSTLEESIGAVKDRSSLLWMFYHPDYVAEVETLEVRLNGRDEHFGTFEPPTGWTLHRVQWDNTFFIRREQQMREPQIEAMLCDMLRFADHNQMRVHSWETGPDLAPDDFQP